MITEERLKELTHQFMQCWMDRDDVALKEITSETFILLSPLAGKDAKTNRTMYLQMVMKLYQLLFFEFRFIHFMLGEQQAIVSSIMTIKITQGGVEGMEEMKYLVTDVWRKEKENWRIVYRHPSYSALIN